MKSSDNYGAEMIKMLIISGIELFVYFFFSPSFLNKHNEYKCNVVYLILPPLDESNTQR